MKYLDADTLQRLAHTATVFAVLISIGAAWDTARINSRAADAQAQAAAVTVLQDYMRLSIEHPDLANRSDALPVDPRYEWFAAYAYVSAETIYRLMRGRPEWEMTVAGMIEYHRRFVEDGKFACADFDRAFGDFVASRLPGTFKCMRL